MLLAIGDQLLLGRKVVVDRLLGDVSLARHVADYDIFVPSFGEEPGRGVGDALTRARLLAFTQSGAGHRTSLARPLHSPGLAAANAQAGVSW